mmetsp:Transcript_18124/g.17268  ORF Transcript_18124/g.17268 Transcript_18124/m.17268 type:complete len:113 (+) Transcript_18124:238-576(+)|eukprot:CAMPEP_0170543652 /NCGR_PEP_ID=MMETSP0211-20121228/2698_1 /TAXON_ID=311385 /ORGANISM="Pseudokeronopsis sp., Strain OXSARD2" /LENGTH=112 /DNA_ID=CAMNT_0010847087 /DNA_START=230 /DNA_END=568 /DNA_ORIENTATION=-
MNQTWNELALAVKDEINIGRMDCDSKVNVILCKELKVVSFPTILYFDEGGLYYAYDDSERAVPNFLNFIFQSKAEKKSHEIPKKKEGLELLMINAYQMLLDLDFYLNDLYMK